MRAAIWSFVLLGIIAMAALLWWERETPARAAKERARAEAAAAAATVDRGDAPEAAPGKAPEAPLTGRVVADEKRVPGARVWAVADRRSSQRAAAPTGPVVAEAETDADGEFELDLPADRDHILYARARGHAVGAELVRASVRECEIELPRESRRRRYRVVDVEERPVGGALVRVFHEDRKLLPVETVKAEADGRFAVTVFDDAFLVVSAPGFATKMEKTDEDFDTIVLTAGAPIAGVVVDGAGAPIPDLLVVLDRAFQAADVVRTGTDGRFRFEGVELDTQSVYVFRGDDQLLADSIEPGDEDVRFVIAAPGTRHGVVVFPDGSPAAGATVGDQKTDAAGRFTYRGPPVPTVYARLGTVAALPNERPPPEWIGSARWPGEAAQPVRIVLKRRHRSFLRVRFVDDASRPVPNVTLGSLPCQKSDENGRAVTAYVLPPGTTVRPYPRGARGFPFRFEAKTHATLAGAPELTVRVPAPARATLVVRLPNGAPLPQGLKPDIRFYFAKLAERTHDSAVFEFDRLSGYRMFHFELRAKGFIRTSGALPFPDENGTVVVRLSRGVEVVGRLLDESGSPTRGWLHVWVPRGGHAGAGIEADGRFRLPGVAPGDARFQFGRQPDHPLLAFERRIEGTRLDLGDVRIQPPRVLRGRVTGDGPLAGVRVRFNHDPHHGVTATRADGTFRLRVLPGLDAKLQISKPGWGSAVVDAVPDQHIQLRRAGRIRLVATRADPPDPRIIAYSFGVRRPGAKTPLPIRVVFRAGSERIFADVPDGPVEVYVETVLGIRAVRVDVAAGQTTDARLTVP